jgi:transcriptional regulator with PAS, ATPase and Fis domain
MARPRRSSTKWIHLLDAALTPVVAVDEDRTIVYCNPALAAAAGAEVEQLVGRRCEYHSAAGATPEAAAAAAICPPPETFAGRPATGSVSLTDTHGSAAQFRALFLPVAAGDGENTVLAWLGPVHASGGGRDECLDEFGQSEAAQLHETIGEFRSWQRGRHLADHLVGNSPQMQKARRQIDVAAQSQASVVIVGPPGSGRRRAARAIHYSRPDGCAWALVTLDAALLEAAELHAALAVESAPDESPSTVLISDVDKLAGEAQIVLADIAGRGRCKSRLISTSRCDLDTLAHEGKLRSDLAAMLSTISVELPSLADRRDDLPLVAQMFLEQINAEGGRQLGGFTPEALDRLAGHPWHGNLAELAEVVASSAAQADGPMVTAANLPESIRLAAEAAAHPPRPATPIVLDELLAEMETELLRRALARSRGNKTKAAKLLGISRARMVRRAGQLGLEESK